MKDDPEKTTAFLKKFGIHNWKDALCALGVLASLTYAAYYAVVSIILGIIWIVVATIYLYHYGKQAKNEKYYSNRLLNILDSYKEDEEAIKNASFEAKYIADVFLEIIDKLKNDNKIGFEEIYYGLAIARNKIDPDDFPQLCMSERLGKILFNELREEMSVEEIINLAKSIEQKRNPETFNDIK